ncbi:MAG: hypothetical protein ACO2PN_11235 [Pyrobaculum sp.]|jgi:hypothetical protein
MSFTSSLPANLPKYGFWPTWDVAKGYERYVRAIYVPDYAIGTDGEILKLSNIDFATGLETIAVLLPQLDRAFASERLRRLTAMHDLLRAVETSLIRVLDTDSDTGNEPGFASLAPKYLDLETGKITTTPTPQSVFIGIGGVSGCVVVGRVVLCYKKIGDTLDWETLQDLLITFKHIDDRVRAWLDLVNERLPDIINRILFELS